MNDEQIQDQGPDVDETATDPDEAAVGVPAAGDEAAAAAEGTVAIEPSAPDSTEDGDAGADPLKDLLERDEYIPKRDYVHAARKITQQGQELSSRDEELQRANDRIAVLEQQITARQQTPAQQNQPGFGFGQQGAPAASASISSDPTVTELKQQVSLLTDAFLELNDQQGQVTERQVIAQRYGVNDARVLDRYEELKSEGKDFEAHDLLRDAKEIATKTTTTARKRRQQAQTQVMDGSAAATSITNPSAPPVDARAQSKDPVDRKLSRRDRLRKNAGLD